MRHLLLKELCSGNLQKNLNTSPSCTNTLNDFGMKRTCISKGIKTSGTGQLPIWRSSLWNFFDVQASQIYSQVLSARKMPGAEWFKSARLNYAEHVFRHPPDPSAALVFKSERHPLTENFWETLQEFLTVFIVSNKNQLTTVS